MAISDKSTCSRTYDGFLYDFHYHREGISLHLDRVLENIWLCKLIFIDENISERVPLVDWSEYLFYYTELLLDGKEYYKKYKSEIRKISYDMILLMEIKTSLVLISKTSHISDHNLKNENIKKICDVIFNDSSVNKASLDPLTDQILNLISSNEIAPSSMKLAHAYTTPNFSDIKNTIAEGFLEILLASYWSFYSRLDNLVIAKILYKYKNK
jgi:hypothetical protein